MKKSVGLESTVGSLFTLSSKKRNVLVDSNKYEYNHIQSMSRDKSKSKLLLGKLRILLHGEIGVGEELLLGTLVTGEVSVGEISGWGSCCWGNYSDGEVNCWGN